MGTKLGSKNHLQMFYEKGKYNVYSMENFKMKFLKSFSTRLEALNYIIESKK